MHILKYCAWFAYNTEFDDLYYTSERLKFDKCSQLNNQKHAYSFPIKSLMLRRIIYNSTVLYSYMLLISFKKLLCAHSIINVIAILCV